MKTTTIIIIAIVALIAIGIFSLARNVNRELPPNESAKITTSGEWAGSLLKLNLNNGSSWNLRKIIIHVSIEEYDGTERWSRDFEQKINIDASTEEEIVLRMQDSDSHGANIYWTIKNVYGTT